MPEPELRVQDSVNRRRGWMLDEPVDQLRLPSGLRQPVSVNGHHLAAPDLECCPERLEPQIQVSLPELVIPPVMVSPHHYYWQSPAEPGERRGDVKPAPGNDPGVGEPEVEEIAVDQQAVAQRRARRPETRAAPPR